MKAMNLRQSLKNPLSMHERCIIVQITCYRGRLSSRITSRYTYLVKKVHKLIKD